MQCQPNRLYVSAEPPAIASSGAGVLSLSGSGPTSALPTSGSAQRRSLRRLLANATASAGGLDGFPWRLEVDFLNNEVWTSTILEDTVEIRVSGVYSMWFVICDQGLPEVCARPPPATRCTSPSAVL